MAPRTPAVRIGPRQLVDVGPVHHRCSCLSLIGPKLVMSERRQFAGELGRSSSQLWDRTGVPTTVAA
jgi:hypothetical protein